MTKDELLDAISENISSDEEIFTRKAYVALSKERDDLPSVKSIEEHFGNYTKFKIEVGYAKTKKSPKIIKERKSLKEFMAEKRGM